ncbi:MAG: hypothetical protein R3F59_03335 [Myxococcota bacterium]
MKRLTVGQVIDLGPEPRRGGARGRSPGAARQAGVQNTVRSVRVKGRVEGGVLK